MKGETVAMYAGFAPVVVLLMWSGGYQPVAWEWFLGAAGAVLCGWSLREYW